MASNYRVLFLAFSRFLAVCAVLSAEIVSAASIPVPGMRRRVPCTRHVYIVQRAYFRHLQSERKENNERTRDFAKRLRCRKNAVFVPICGYA